MMGPFFQQHRKKSIQKLKAKKREWGAYVPPTRHLVVKLKKCFRDKLQDISILACQKGEFIGKPETSHRQLAENTAAHAKLYWLIVTTRIRDASFPISWNFMVDKDKRKSSLWVLMTKHLFCNEPPRPFFYTHHVQYQSYLTDQSKLPQVFFSG